MLNYARYDLSALKLARVLTLIQPWASLIAHGKKTYETRSWAPHAGALDKPVLIHAGKKVDEFCEWQCETLNAIPTPTPRGVIVAVAWLVKAHPTESLVDDITIEEYRWGDWESGRWAWELADVIPLETPFAATGSLGLWRPDETIIGEVARQLTEMEEADKQIEEEMSRWQMR